MRHDIYTKVDRSRIMSRIRSSGTLIERLMEGALKQYGIEYVAQPVMLGRPDFLIPEKRTVVFCDGEFWHGYKFGRNPRHDVRDNRDFWIGKIKQNMKRDRFVTRHLRQDGWRVIRFWEHEVKLDPGACVQRIEASV